MLGSDLISREKKELMVSCEIAGFEKGLTRLLRTPSEPDDSVDKYAGHEKDRVIAINCLENTNVLENFR